MTDQQPESRHYVFVCYARGDAVVAVPLIETLRRSGLHIWRDVEGIDGAAFWRKEIVEAICGCSLVLFLASKRSVTSDNVKKELALADEERKSILPVYLDDVHPPAELRYQVAGLQHIAYWKGKDDALRQIQNAIQHHGIVSAKAEAQSTPTAFAASAFSRRRILIIAAPIVAFAGIVVIAVTQMYNHRATAQSQKPAVSPASSVIEHVASSSLVMMKDTWYVETTTTDSEYGPYLGLRMRYRLLLTQDRDSITAQGEKIGEVRNGETLVLTGRGKTPVRFTGHLVARSNMPPVVTFLGTEGSTSRDYFTTTFSLTMLSSNILVGTFKSTAANASGPAVWISDIQWRTTGWSVPVAHGTAAANAAATPQVPVRSP